MEEVEASSLFFSANHFNCKFFILRKNCRKIFFGNCIRFARIRNYRLNAELIKTKIIGNMINVLCKIEIVFCKSSACIIFLVFAFKTFFNKFLELRNNYVIASFSVDCKTHIIVYAFSSVEGKNNVFHLLIDVINVIIIKKNAVGGYGKTEFFLIFFFLASGIVNNFFNRIPVLNQ